jgi:FkbM family methyltransferase
MINKLIEEISWIPYILRNQYLCRRDKIVLVDNHNWFSRIRFPFEVINDKDFHSLSRNLQVYKFREPRNANEFKKFVEGDDIVLDVGANIGFFTILAKNAKRIIAIEPVRRCIPILKRNLIMNRVNNVEVLNIALGNGGKVYIKEDGAVNLSRVVNKKTYGSKLIDSMTLGEFSKKYKMNLVKIDAEGYEYEVFGKDKIPKSVNKIMMEFHTGLMGKDKSIQLINNLYKNGFYVEKLIEDLPLRLYPFMRILTRVMGYVKEDLTRKETIEEVFKGRALKYLYLRRRETQTD